MEYLARDYGVIPGADATVALQTALERMAEIAGEKTLVLEQGEYHLYSRSACKPKLFITNTVGDRQWKRGEAPHVNCVALRLHAQRDLTIDGNGSVFVLHGQMTNVAITQCSNLTLRGLTLRTDNPDMHELRVVACGGSYAEFELDRDSRYERRGRRYDFVGQDYRTPFTAHCNTARWIARIPHDDANSVCRVAHPLRGRRSIREIAPHRFRVSYWGKRDFRVGDAFYLYDERRKYQGIFIDRSERIELRDLEQNFNYGLALVCQDSADIGVYGCRFRPASDGAKRMASAADFVQICMCRGDVTLRDNTFVGAGDDCLNAHGVHYRIVRVQGDRIDVRYCHPQTHGFNPLRAGDAIAFVSDRTLLARGQTRILQTQMLDEYTIRLQLEDASLARKGDVIEDKSAVPNVEFSRNFMTRIITRGVLLTVGGKAVIADNDFDNTSMHSILISDDARSWYESGNVTDVEIRGNRFGRCVGYTVQVLPENRVHGGAVHRNIRVTDNRIESGDQGGFYFKSAGGVVLRNNRSAAPLRIECVSSQVANEDADASMQS